MKKTVVALGILALLLAAFLWAARNLNAFANRNRDVIAASMSRQLGRSIAFDEVGLSLRGGLSVAVRNLRVAEDPGFGSGSFLRIPSLEIVVNLLPAVFGRISVRRIELDRPSLTLVRSNQGWNIASLSKAQAATAEQAGAELPEPRDAPDGNGEALAAVAAFVRVAQASVRIVDRSFEPERQWVVDRLDFSARDVSAGRTPQFQLDARMFSDGQDLHARGKIEQLFSRDGEPPTLLLEIELSSAKLEAVLAALPIPLAGRIAGTGPLDLDATLKATSSRLRAHATVKAGATRVDYPPLLAKAAGVALMADLTVSADRETGVRVQPAILRIGPIESIVQGTLSDGRGGGELSISVARLALAELTRLNPKLADMSLSGAASAELTVTQDRGGGYALDGSIELEQAGAAPADLPPLSDLSAAIRAEGHTLRLPPSEFRLGGSALRADATISDFSDPTVVFNLAAERLSSSALGLEGDGKRSNDSFTFAGFSLSGLMRVVAGEGLRARARVAAESGRLGSLALTKPSAMLRIESGRLIFDPLSARTLGGTISAEGVYDPSDSAPAGFNCKAHLDELAVAELLSQRLGANSPLEGRLDADLSLAGTVGAWPQLRDSLVGGGSLVLRDGTLHDVNLAGSALQKITKISGLSALLSPTMSDGYPEVFRIGETRFQELRSRFTIAKGTLISDDISVGASDYMLLGRGEIGLDGWIDVRGTLEASQSLTSDLVASVSALRLLAAGTNRLSLPLRIRGRAPALSVQPDITFIRQRVERALAEGVIESILGRPPSIPSDPETEKQKASDGQPASPSDKLEPQTAPPPQAAESPPEQPSPADQLLRGLESLLGR